MTFRHKFLRPRGFTLIELLVAIAIIGLLIGIAVFGFNAMQRNAARNRTKVALQGASSMLAEYDVATGLRKQPPHMWLPNNSVYTTVGFNFWQDADPSDTTPAGPKALASPGRVDSDRPAPPAGGRVDLPAVKNTQIVMGLLNSMPAAKKIMGQLPADSLLQLPENTTTTAWSEATPPVPTDAWDNPIVFVPAAGLGVTIGDPAVPRIVTSVRLYEQGTGAGQLAEGTVAPNARPFFASAGPDGDFLTGDDNMYSFEN